MENKITFINTDIFTLCDSSRSYFYFSESNFFGDTPVTSRSKFR